MWKITPFLSILGTIWRQVSKSVPVFLSEAETVGVVQVFPPTVSKWAGVFWIAMVAERCDFLVLVGLLNVLELFDVSPLRRILYVLVPRQFRRSLVDVNFLRRFPYGVIPLRNRNCPRLNLRRIRVADFRFRFPYAVIRLRNLKSLCRCSRFRPLRCRMLPFPGSIWLVPAVLDFLIFRSVLDHVSELRRFEAEEAVSVVSAGVLDWLLKTEYPRVSRLWAHFLVLNFWKYFKSLIWNCG